MPSPLQNIPGTSREPWRRLISASADTAALTYPSITADASLTEATAGVFNTGRFPLARLMFAGTDAANETINYQVIGWQYYKGNTTPGGDGYVPLLLAKGVATLGSKVLGAAGADVESATALAADTITDTLGHAGTRLFVNAANDTAWLEVDCANCMFIQVQTDLGTAATASAIYQRGERAERVEAPKVLLREEPKAALVAGTAEAWLEAPANAYGVHLTVTAAPVRANFVAATSTSPAAAGRRLLVNSQVELDVPTSQRWLCYARIGGTNGAIDPVWLVGD